MHSVLRLQISSVRRCILLFGGFIWFLIKFCISFGWENLNFLFLFWMVIIIFFFRFNYRYFCRSINSSQVVELRSYVKSFKVLIFLSGYGYVDEGGFHWLSYLFNEKNGFFVYLWAICWLGCEGVSVIWR